MANRARRGRGRGAEPERNPPIAPGPAQPAAAHNFVQPVIPPRHKDPPVFRGAADEDVVNWIFRFEQIADYNQWNPDQRLRHIGMCFEGVAEKWHCSLMTRVPPPLTFDAFREELLRAFKPVNYEDHLETRLRSRVQGSGESFVDYFHDVLFMCSRIDPTMSERSKIGHLFRGLLPGTVRGIYRFIQPDSTTNDLFREAQIFLQGEDIAAKREKSSESVPPIQPILHMKSENPSQNSDPSPGPSDSSAVSREELKQMEKRILDNIAKAMEGANRQGTQREQRDQGKRDRPPTGYGRNKRTRDGRPICNDCGKPGHIARFCGKEKDSGKKEEPQSKPKPEPGPPSAKN